MELEEKIERAVNKVMTKFEGGLEIKTLDSVEAIEAEIKMLQSKLEFYKELEKHKTPCEKAFKRVYGYYSNSNASDTTWIDFVNGYKSAQEDYKVGEYQETVEEPEDKEAKEESWMDKPVEELVKVLEKNPPECLKFELGKSLTDLIHRWWEDVFTTHSDWDMETSIEDLVDQIQMWLPKEQSAAGSQNLYVECSVEGFNDAIKKIKSKLR